MVRVFFRDGCSFDIAGKPADHKRQGLHLHNLSCWTIEATLSDCLYFGSMLMFVMFVLWIFRQYKQEWRVKRKCNAVHWNIIMCLLWVKIRALTTSYLLSFFPNTSYLLDLLINNSYYIVRTFIETIHSNNCICKYSFAHSCVIIISNRCYLIYHFS